MYDESLVSVIIPTHNAADTIERCLESILNQTYGPIEIICCDDCSSDNTLDIIKKYEARGVKVLANDRNMRAAYSRNRCIEISSGQFIAQIDDDDYCVPERIEKQVRFLQENPKYDFVGTGIFYFDENGVWGQSGWEEGYAPTKESFLRNSVFINPSMMYRASCIKMINGYRGSKETRRSQEYDMHMRLYIAGYLGYVLPDRLTYYYRGEKSYPKIKYEYRIDEAKIRFRNYKALGLMPKGAIYALKPLIVGLIPSKLVDNLFKKKKLKVKSL